MLNNLKRSIFGFFFFIYICYLYDTISNPSRNFRQCTVVYVTSVYNTQPLVSPRVYTRLQHVPRRIGVQYDIIGPRIRTNKTCRSAWKRADLFGSYVIRVHERMTFASQRFRDWTRVLQSVRWQLKGAFTVNPCKTAFPNLCLVYVFKSIDSFFNFFNGYFNLFIYFFCFDNRPFCLKLKIINSTRRVYCDFRIKI